MSLPKERTIVVLAGPLERELEKDQPCTVEGCDRLRLARGLCNIHYYRARRALLRQQRDGQR